jgi:diketogulonate reductase-like aldo/keto reductase
MSPQVPLVTLNNGVQMPILGFGIYQIPPEQTEQAVTDALAAGYRHIDTAAAYVNEEAVGRAIAASGIPRDELFITTKLWVADSGEDAARRAFDRSLQRLGLDHLDLYLIHQPFGDYYGSWRAMEKLQHAELVRAIGVSNFYSDRLVDLIDHNDVTPAVNQIETHPYFQRADYQTLMRERGVQIESFGDPSRRDATASSPTRRSARSGSRAASPSLRSCCGGSSSAASSSSPSPSDPNGWPRTSTSSTSPSPTTTCLASPRWTTAPRCSWTTATQQSSASSVPSGSTDHTAAADDDSGPSSAATPTRAFSPRVSRTAPVTTEAGCHRCPRWHPAFRQHWAWHFARTPGWVEVAGIEPASFDASPGLLRAQSALPLLGPVDHADKST